MGRRLVLVVLVALVALVLQASFSPAPAAVPSSQPVIVEPSSSDQIAKTTVWYVQARLNDKLPWNTVATFPQSNEAYAYAKYLRTLGYLTKVFSKTF